MKHKNFICTSDDSDSSGGDKPLKRPCLASPPRGPHEEQSEGKEGPWKPLTEVEEKNLEEKSCASNVGDDAAVKDDDARVEEKNDVPKVVMSSADKEHGTRADGRNEVCTDEPSKRDSHPEDATDVIYISDDSDASGDETPSIRPSTPAAVSHMARNRDATRPTTARQTHTRLPVDLRALLASRQQVPPSFTSEQENYDAREENDARERFRTSGRYLAYISRMDGFREPSEPSDTPEASDGGSSDPFDNDSDPDDSDSDDDLGDNDPEDALEFADAEWPPSIPHIAANYNPYGVCATYQGLFGRCDCVLPCRTDTCRNSALGIYCTEECCRFRGMCANGLVEYRSVQQENLRLMRIRGTHNLTVVATKPIERGVIVGEYFGELSLQSANRHNRARNEGYRLHLHPDENHRRNQRVCINALRLGSLMRFANHACSPTAEFYERANKWNRTVVVATTRDVSAGEEVTVDYGEDLWFTCRCRECENRRE